MDEYLGYIISSYIVICALYTVVSIEKYLDWLNRMEVKMTIFDFILFASFIAAAFFWLLGTILKKVQSGFIIKTIRRK